MNRAPQLDHTLEAEVQSAPVEVPLSAGRFEQLWAAAELQVAVFLGATVFSRTDRQDLGQVIAQKAWTAFASFRPDQGGFTAWVLGIARNEYLHYVRSHRRARVLFDSELADQAVGELCRSEDPSADERPAVLRRALAELAPESRDLLRLKYEQELTCGEIAARLGIQEDAVRKRLHRIRTALKERVAGGRDGDPPA